MISEDEINPDTWRLSFERTPERTLCSVHVEFKHLTITTEDTFRTTLEKPPEIKETVKARISSSALLSSTFRSSLDLSRNFFVSFNLNEVIKDVVQKLKNYMEPELADLFSQNLRIICLMSNDLQNFPPSPILPNLEEIYVNHNHIAVLPVGFTPFSWITSPKLHLVDMRNNSLVSIVGLSTVLNGHQQLQHLSLSSNRLTVDACYDLPSCPNLRILGLFSNLIDQSAIETPIETLKRFLKLLVDKYPLLEDLYLLGNPLTEKLNHDVYRETVLTCCPRLKFLDGQSC